MAIREKLDIRKIQKLREKAFELICPGSTWLEACQLDRAGMIGDLEGAVMGAGHDNGKALESLMSCWDLVKSGFESAARLEETKRSRPWTEPRIVHDQTELLDIALRALDHLRRAQRHHDWNPGIGHNTDRLMARMDALAPGWKKLT